MNKQLRVDLNKCNGCGLCQLACAVTHNRQFNPSLARIKIWREEGRGLNVPMVCQQCAEPPCAAACLMNVIYKDPASGITQRDYDHCIGCRACQAACPFDASCYDHTTDVVVNCDLCEGSPACVEICPFGALQYSVLDETLESIREAEALKRVAIPERERSQNG